MAREGKERNLSMADSARSLVAEALSQPISEIPETAAIGNVPGWDSLGHMRILLLIEQRLGRELEPAVAVQLTDIKAIRAMLNCPDC
jgi:acyl carrier protein